MHDAPDLPLSEPGGAASPLQGAGPVHADLCVLGSGSAGNCSVIRVMAGGKHSLCLIDLGLSPRRVFRELGGMGLRPDNIDAVLITHFDGDHCHAGWCRPADGPDRPPPLARHTEVFVLRSHADAARRLGLNGGRVALFDRSFSTRAGLAVKPHVAAHDAEGSVSYRVSGGNWSLGFATDVGRVDAPLLHHLRGVDVLAIESNYCPEMQLASGRSAYLKQRIMGGRGHLSNQESHRAVQQLQPVRHVVLLHLSRQCNKPELPAELHRDRGYELTITSQHEPTPWVKLGTSHGGSAHPDMMGSPPRIAVRPAPGRQMSLFGR